MSGENGHLVIKPLCESGKPSCPGRIRRSGCQQGEDIVKSNAMKHSCRLDYKDFAISSLKSQIRALGDLRGLVGKRIYLGTLDRSVTTTKALVGYV